MTQGIVLIDLHQLNVKTTSDNTNQRHWIRDNLMSTKRTEPAEQQPATSSFPSQMIEQINIALEQKGSGNFSAWVIGRHCRRGITSEKRAYTSIKSDEEWTSRVLPSEQDDIVKFIITEGIAVIELRISPLSWQWQTACWLCHRLNSLND